MRMLRRLVCCLNVALTVAAHADSTTTYTYDALGRLIQADTAGTVNDGVKLDVDYDPTDNRTKYQVTKSANKVIVLPINGYTIIPIKDD